MSQAATETHFSAASPGQALSRFRPALSLSLRADTLSPSQPFIIVYCMHEAPVKCLKTGKRPMVFLSDGMHISRGIVNVMQYGCNRHGWLHVCEIERRNEGAATDWQIQPQQLDPAIDRAKEREYAK